MKKAFFTAAFIALSMTAAAQTTEIRPALQKDLYAVYNTDVKVEVSGPQGSQDIKASYQSRFTVQSVAADTAIVCMQIPSAIIPDDTKLSSAIQAVLSFKGTDIIFSTDMSGKPRYILNYKDVHAHMYDVCKSIAEKEFKENPMLAQQMKLEDLVAAIDNQITPATVLKQVSDFDALALNGKKLTTGLTEDSEESNVKVKSTYTVGKVLGITTVAVSTKTNMTKEEMKEAFFATLDKSGISKEQADQVKSQWGMLEAAGMAKMEANGTSTYHFVPNGWLSDVTSSTDINVMGSEVKTNSTTKLSDHSWK